MPSVPTLLSPQCTKARLKVTEKDLKSLQWEHEVLEQRFVQVSSQQLVPTGSRWSCCLPLAVRSSLGRSLWHVRPPGPSGPF